MGLFKKKNPEFYGHYGASLFYRAFLLFGVIGITFVFITYTQDVILRLKEEETQNVEVYARLYQALINPEASTSDIDLIFETIIQKARFPMVFSDSAGNPQNWRLLDKSIDTVTAKTPAVDFEAPDHVRHTLWRVGGADRDALVAAFGRIPALYIADGHHRAASAARARNDIRERGLSGTSLGDGADYSTMLAVAFPHNQVQILPYNRVARNLAGLSPDAFLQSVRERFNVEAGPAVPHARGDIAMFFGGAWHTLRARVRPTDPIGSFDVSVLQDQLMAPILKILDVRTDKRIDFVGGARGTSELEALVQSGKAAVAFSLYPVSVSDLMSVSDAGEVMPPKSTWFEPKLRDGLLIHLM